MPNMTINSSEIQSASVGDEQIIKIFLGDVLVYLLYREPLELIDADGKNVLDSDGNQILVY